MFEDSFDPSGHICATLIAMEMYLEMVDRYPNQLPGKVVYYTMLLHSWISLFWTSYIYHTIQESIAGLWFGIILSLTGRLIYL
jgi:hypothetical protein